jgi:hypothetical protein
MLYLRYMAYIETPRKTFEAYKVSNQDHTEQKDALRFLGIL